MKDLVKPKKPFFAGYFLNSWTSGRVTINVKNTFKTREEAKDWCVKDRGDVGDDMHTYGLCGNYVVGEGNAKGLWNVENYTSFRAWVKLDNTWKK